RAGLPDLEVVDEGEVDAWQTQTCPGLLERAHGAVVAVVEGREELQAERSLIGEIVARPDRPHPAADLGRQHGLLAIDRAQEMADAQFAAAIAVEGGGVVIA